VEERVVLVVAAGEIASSSALLFNLRLFHRRESEANK